MKAVVFHNVKDIRYEPNWPEPHPLREGEVLIATSWCGICGTDMEDYTRGAIIPIGEPHPVSGRMAPMVIGHEYSGRIAEVGPGVKDLKVDQKVAIECVKVCHRCYWCKLGEYASCLNQVSIGQVDDGGMAEYFIVPAENCIPIPEEMPDDIAAMAEPLAVMVRGVRRGRVTVGDLVTVVGAGTIGLMGIAVARAAGARKVISIAHGGHRAEVASLMGASHVLNSKEDGWHEEFMDITNGLGSEVVIDAAGNLSAMRMAVDLTMRRGRCVLNSVVADEVKLSAWDMVIDEKELIGTVAHSFDREFLWAVQYLLDGRVNVEPVITDRIYVEDAVGKGFDRLLKDRNQIKILVALKKELLK
ncbi:MAG: alcohol dehydrogenase catalytic domain-containing protein [Anaerolineaceae bacterium]|nr:alcohol dehydrogenase catalytic domain-containing protein [Anaerolineaceae bacterium]